MLNGWRLHSLSWFLLALVFIILYVHWAPPLQQIESQPLDLAPVLSPSRLIANVRDLGTFAATMVPPVQAEEPPMAQATSLAEMTSTSSISPPVTEAADLTCVDEWCHSLSWWQKQAGDHWVDQVVVLSDRMKAVNYIQTQPDSSLFSYFPVNRSTGVVWIVVFGDFRSKTEAQAIGEVRDFGLQAKPFPKSVAAIVEELHSADQQQRTSQLPVQGSLGIKSTTPDASPGVPGVDEPLGLNRTTNQAPNE